MTELQGVEVCPSVCLPGWLAGLPRYRTKTVNSVLHPPELLFLWICVRVCVCVSLCECGPEPSSPCVCLCSFVSWTEEELSRTSPSHHCRLQ